MSSLSRSHSSRHQSRRASTATQDPIIACLDALRLLQVSRTTFQTFGPEHDLRRTSRTSRSTLALDDFLSLSADTSLSYPDPDAALDSDHDSLISTTDDDSDSLISIPRSCGDRTAIQRQSSFTSTLDEPNRVLISNLESIIADLSTLTTALSTELHGARQSSARLAIELDVARQRQSLYKQQLKLQRQECAGLKARLRSQAGSRVYPRGARQNSDSDRSALSGERATVRMSKGSELKILLTLNDSTHSTPQHRPSSLVLSADFSSGSLAPPAASSPQPGSPATPKIPNVKRLSRTAKNAFAHFARTPAIPANWHEPPETKDTTPRPSTTSAYRSQTSSVGALSMSDNASIISTKTAKPAKRSLLKRKTPTKPSSKPAPRKSTDVPPPYTSAPAGSPVSPSADPFSLDGDSVLDYVPRRPSTGLPRIPALSGSLIPAPHRTRTASDASVVGRTSVSTPSVASAGSTGVRANRLRTSSNASPQSLVFTFPSNGSSPTRSGFPHGPSGLPYAHAGMPASAPYQSLTFGQPSAPSTPSTASTIVSAPAPAPQKSGLVGRMASKLGATRSWRHTRNASATRVT